MLEKLIAHAVRGGGCSGTEALWLVGQDEQDLFCGATQIREAHHGNTVQLCSIINAKSGQCDMDCRFCSQSAHNSTDIETYPFLDFQTLETRIRDTLDSNDRRCGVVTSGGKLSSTELDAFADTVQTIGNKNPAPICASLGRLTAHELARLKSAGVTRFHHNLESSERYYPQVCTTQTWFQRLETVKAAMAAGLEVCCGGLFGLGESWDDRVSLALTLRELGIDSVPINFLYPHDGTPLRDMPPLVASEALRIIALYRFMLPKATLRVCGGRTHVLGERQAELFAAGANGIMTGNYLTVAGSLYESDLEMIRSLSMEPASLEKNG
ncbi:MAG: biotin synthase BioB [Kiritimatiellales bacterium]|nr:biotin synthase BioB [Kiritimatiellales bacterium]